MQVLSIINLILGALFLMCYAFQLAYLFIPFIKKLPAHKEASLHRYCIIVCARNEQNVISDLYESIRRQDYPAELIDVVLVADNCNDKTAEVGRALGMSDQAFGIWAGTAVNDTSSVEILISSVFSVSFSVKMGAFMKAININNNSDT